MNLLIVAGLWQNSFAQGSIDYNPDNGHYYQAFFGSYAWPDARDLAASMTYLEMSGHLATITSPAENSFVYGVYAANFYEDINPSSGSWVWLGGYQPTGSLEPVGGWSWVTGENFTYSRWASGQPSDSGGNPNGNHQDFLMMWGQGRWNDASGPGFGGGALDGFFVEFEAVPEPDGLGYLAVFASCGLVWLKTRYQRAV